ncbi:MAG TPA: NAD(P)/FAD-dependent oxidoreductase [Solirubrobacteraceae bacterium]|jgi:flavin-dependent dehydrogenase
MPIRATKRGTQRTRLQRDCDVLICGASFAGLAVARELAGSGAQVLIVDRYEIGERQTSACGIPTDWLTALSLQSSLRQTFDSLLVHTPWSSLRWQLPWSFSTFDYKEICALLWEQTGLPHDAFETAKVDGLAAPCIPATHAQGDAGEPLSLHTVVTDRGEIRAPYVIDALGWRRVLSRAIAIQPPNARLSRGLEVHPDGSDDEMQLWIDARYVRSGYGWSFPAKDEVRIGIGSFWPSHHVKEPTVRLAEDLGRPADGYQGNWIPHQLRPATEDGVFFVGDSAGHCLPLTAEGIRTALYFGIACGRELRAALEGRSSREQALRAYGAFSDSHEWKFRWMLHSQRIIGRLTTTPAVTALSHAMHRKRIADWAFEHYLAIAPPSFVDAGPRRTSVAVPAAPIPA